MSKTNFSSVFRYVETLATIRARNVDALRASTRKISKGEREKVDALVHERFGDFTDKATQRVASRFLTALPGAARLSLETSKKLAVPEASGVAPLSNGRALCVGDDQGIFFVGADGQVNVLVSATDEKHPSYAPELRGLEGIALDAERTKAFVVSEDTRTVFRLSMQDDGRDVKLGRPVVLGRLPKLSGGTVNGWEGIDVMPGRFLNMREDLLVGAHEADPTRLVFARIPGEGSADEELEVVRSFKIPREAREHLLDIGDVAIDPTNGHIFLVSDRCKKIVELELCTRSQGVRGGLLEHATLRLVAVTAIPDGEGTKPEGLGFSPDAREAVLVAEHTKKRSHLWRFEVNREAERPAPNTTARGRDRAQMAREERRAG